MSDFNTVNIDCNKKISFSYNFNDSNDKIEVCSVEIGLQTPHTQDKIEAIYKNYETDNSLNFMIGKDNSDKSDETEPNMSYIRYKFPISLKTDNITNYEIDDNLIQFMLKIFNTETGEETGAETGEETGSATAAEPAATGTGTETGTETGTGAGVGTGAAEIDAEKAKAETGTETKTETAAEPAATGTGTGGGKKRKNNSKKNRTISKKHYLVI